MKETMDVAKVASKDIELYLRGLPETINVFNVEDEDLFREYDVDLLWKTENGIYLIEIKGDRYYKTGNYFFETTSNKSKDSLGCFLYTRADFIYYYFVEQREIHILPMPDTKKWFLNHIDSFKESTTSTNVGKGNYVSTGRLVPRNLVLNKEIINLP